MEDETWPSDLDMFFDLDEASPDFVMQDAFDVPACSAAGQGLQTTISTSSVPLHEPRFDNDPNFSIDPSTLDLAPVAEWTSAWPGSSDRDLTSKTQPNFWYPDVACDYCRSMHFECFFFRDQADCSTCKSLFRCCSFNTTNDQLSSNFREGFIDTLSTVTEDQAHETGTWTSKKALFTMGASMNAILDDLMQKKPDKYSPRFPRATVQILKEWLSEHCEHPYPNNEEKTVLMEQTGLSSHQIATWLANARRRGKVRPKRCKSPSAASTSRSSPIDIPKPTQAEWADMTPMDRWKHSPVENEPVSISDINKAMATTRYEAAHSTFSSRTPSAAGPHNDSNSESAWSLLRAQSENTSFETGQSEGSRGSYGSRGSGSSCSSFGRKVARNRRRKILGKARKGGGIPENNRPFQCTFCPENFVIKYDWARHEKTVHLAVENWMCAPFGPTFIDPATGIQTCAYCRALNPTRSHLEDHCHFECEERVASARTFLRKDHLRQHLRLVHKVPMASWMESWLQAVEPLRSRCGFCPGKTGQEMSFTTWNERADHLAAHFKEGAQMSQWQGGWGFEPAIEAMVTNASHPQNIGEKAVSEHMRGVTTFA